MTPLCVEVPETAAREISMGETLKAAADDHRDLKAVRADRVTGQLRNSKGGRKTEQFQPAEAVGSISYL
jgi:hypothetical protein